MIDLDVTLVVNRGLEIRGIVADLVCEERWSHLAFVQERLASERSSASSEFIGYMVDRVGDVKGLFDDAKGSKPEHGRWAEVESDVDRHQVYILGTTRIGEWVKLGRGITTLKSQIQIPTDPPPHSAKALVKWNLRVKADVAWGLDATAAEAIDVI